MAFFEVIENGKLSKKEVIKRQTKVPFSQISELNILIRSGVKLSFHHRFHPEAKHVVTVKAIFG